MTTRKRKDADENDIKVQVCLYAFDLLFLNGESLVRQPLSYRRDLLMKHFKTIEGEFMLATAKVSGMKIFPFFLKYSNVQHSRQV